MKKELYMERRVRRGREAWASIVDEQERSGLSAKDFCQRESIGLASFYLWRRRLGGSSSEIQVSGIESTRSFIDMGQLASSADRSIPTSSNPWVVTLDLGEGCKLTLQRG